MERRIKGFWKRESCQKKTKLLILTQSLSPFTYKMGLICRCPGYPPEGGWEDEWVCKSNRTIAKLLSPSQQPSKAGRAEEGHGPLVSDVLPSGLISWDSVHFPLPVCAPSELRDSCVNFVLILTVKAYKIHSRQDDRADCQWLLRSIINSHFTELIVINFFHHVIWSPNHNSHYPEYIQIESEGTRSQFPLPFS